MEMARRLKMAIENLTAETVTAGKSADRASSRILWLSAFLVLLMVRMILVCLGII
jgi:hypothetical protein